MVNKKNEEKQIPIKNYAIVLVVSILVILAALYARSFYMSYQASKLNTSYFVSKKVSEIKKDDYRRLRNPQYNHLNYQHIADD